MKRILSLSVLFFAWALAFAGCSKIPTFEEATGAANVAPPPVAPAAVQQEAPPRPITPAPPPVPQGPSPDEVIANFKRIRPHELEDGALQSLLKLDEGLEGITEIDASMNQKLTPNGFKNIGKLPNLLKLVLNGTRLTDEVLDHIAGIATLEELQLNNSAITGSGLTSLNRLDNLHTLELNSCNLGDLAWAAIGDIPNLKTLKVSKTGVSNDAMKFICNAKNLTSIDLEYTGVTDAGLMHLSKLNSGLERLHLTQCSVTGQGFQGLTKGKGGKSLKWLGLYADGALVPAGAKLILQFNSLEVLSFGPISGIDDQYVNQICGSLPKLKLLDLSGAGGGKLSDAAFKSVGKLKQLEEIRLGSIPGLSDATLKSLTACKELRKVSIEGRVTEKGCHAFKELLPDCTLHTSRGQY